MTPISVGAIDPVGMTNASASNVLNKKASAQRWPRPDRPRMPRDRFEAFTVVGRGRSRARFGRCELLMLRFYLMNPIRANWENGKGMLVPGMRLNECGQKTSSARPTSRSRSTNRSFSHSRASMLGCCRPA